MIMCVMDNIQSRFYIQIYIDIKEHEENIPGLLNFYLRLHSFLVYLRDKYRTRFFEIMKNWDALSIGFIVSDEVNDMGFCTLRDTLLKDLYEIMDTYDADQWVEFVTVHSLAEDRDQLAHLSLFFSNLCKNYGHPILQPADGIAKLRENSKKIINVDRTLAEKTLWKFRQTYMISFFKKRGHYPQHRVVGSISQQLNLCLTDSRLPTTKERPMIPLSDWGSIHLKKNHELALEIDEKELLKDTACSPPRTEWFIPYDPCAFKILYGQRKPRGSGTYEPRVLARYLKGEEGELAKKIGEQEKLYYNHMRDDIVQLCRKERELNVQGRVFCKQTYEMRLLQVALEKSLSDNILPFIREQTMTSTELEVTKRMDKVASTISKEGNYNINLDLTKWNQLQRLELNNGIFNELDQLHGRENLYSDSHTWFNRCVVLLSSRLTPPRIGANGEPEPGDFCHYDQLGGFEGMRQKAWTLTTIMIIKLALDDCDLIGETMGQGDNQVIHLKLNKQQQSDPLRYIKLLLNTLDHYFSLGGLKMKIEETWFSQNLFEYSKTRFYKAIRIDDSLKKLNRLVPDINEGFPSLQSLITGASTTTENLSRNCNSPCVPFLLYSLEVGNIMRRKGLIDPVNDKMRLPVLLNSPSVFGGLPLSNLYQHCQRGCPDPLTIWVKVWQIIRIDYHEVFQLLQSVMPCTVKMPMDPIRLVEDMYSLNIISLPNFERRAREIVEEFLPHYVTNPHVVRLLGASREDLEKLCSILITMNPYIANLAHEILRNSNEGVQLQLIGSFTNLQTINRMINEQPGEQDTIFQAGLMKDKEAIQTLINRFKNKDRYKSHQHLIAGLIESEPCSFTIAVKARELTWGFPITGITSPVPCEQISIQDYDQSGEAERSDCIIAKVSYNLKTVGMKALTQRGPYTPYLGSSTPEKMTKPKLTVTCPNPNVKSIRKLYYIMTYLTRMDPRSELIGLLRKMIEEKLATLPKVFQSVPLEDWCGKNYGGSYEHRFKASSQKRSALYALTTNLATHVTLNTNQLGKALRGNEDYNLFFQEIFLFVQNYIAEVAIRGFQVYDTYAIPLRCKDCTYQIVNKPISLGVESLDYKSRMMVELPNSSLSSIDLTPCVRICTAAMSISIGRRLSQTRLHESEVHDARESYGNTKTEESSDRLSSNFMSEFRSCDLNYVFVGALQSNKQLRDYALSEGTEYPSSFFEHLAYLVINSERLPEIALYLGLKIEKHSSVTQVSGLSKVLAHAFRNYISENSDLFFRACTFSYFKSDLISNHAYWWRIFLVKLLTEKNKLSKIQLLGIKRLPTLGGETTCDWNKKLKRDERRHLTLEIPYDENDAISVWRDLKGMINEMIGPVSPLSEKMKTKNWEAPRLPAPSLLKRNQDTFIFNPNCLETFDDSNCPIWTRYIHHICRTVGKISTSASKMFHVLDYYPKIWEEDGLVVALAEGSGGILHTLAHVFPESNLIYNTLQTDTVELKENALNCEPPAFIGDPCRLLERLHGLKDLCLGESDITKDAFVNKLSSLLRNLGEYVSVWSMDAELKTDMSNFDKIEAYLPLAGEFLSENGVLVNKMFLFTPEQVLKLRLMVKQYGYVCNIHKPASSHPHNHEFYVVIFHETSIHRSVQDIIGESHIGRHLLSDSGGKVMRLHQYRLAYFKHLTSKMRNDVLTHFFHHPCIGAIRRGYELIEISIHFLTHRHQRNLILMIMNIESKQSLIDETTHLNYPSDFLSKDILSSLLVLSISLGSCKTPDQVVSVLDTLSYVHPVSNIIPGKGIELQLIPIDAFSDGTESVIGFLGNRVKDLMRTINFFTTKLDSVPQLGLADQSIPQETLEKIRRSIKNKLLDIVLRGESGYTAYLKIKKGEIQ